jgi:ribonuclease P protein component
VHIALQVVNDIPKPLSAGFPRSARLRKHADFQAVYHEGRKRFSESVTVFFRERRDDAGPRVGFTVGKMLGGAVERNRIRRRLRAVARRRLSLLTGPIDVVMHPRKSVLNLGFQKLDSEVRELFAAIEKGRAR